jgi:hypothetical protein
MRNETLFNRIENMGIYALHQIFNCKKGIFATSSSLHEADD